jgi:hypothetical protein
MTRSLEELSLADMVADALAQQGVRAVVLEKDNGLEVSTREARAIWIDAAADLQQWTMLPVNIRQRKANLLAMRFIHLRNGGDPQDSPKSGASFQGPAWLAPIAEKVKDAVDSPRVKIIGAVVLALIVVVTIVELSLKPPPPPPPPDPASETAAQRSARLGRACEAARAMMWRGGAWTAMPLEGWTVELWLSRKDGEPISTHPALGKLVSGGQVSWGEKSVFAQIPDGKAEVIAGPAVAPRSDAIIIFGDGYARPFFEMDHRHEFLAIGEQMVKTRVPIGRLFMRIAHISLRAM